MANANKRWTFEVEHDGLVQSVPEFVMLGFEELRHAIQLDDHVHPGCFEFVLIENGKASWELDGRVYETQAGDLFHTRPGELHRGGFKVIEPSKFWWLIIRAPKQADWLGLMPEESRLMKKALFAQPRIVQTGLNPVPGFKRLRNALLSAHPYRSIAIRQCIVELILHFLNPEREEPPIAHDILRKFGDMMERIKREPEWRPTVKEMADAAGISVSHLHRTFQQFTGFSPMRFMERARMEEACRLLTESELRITEIAYRLGYPSSQHFATAFKRMNGESPLRWRKMRRT